MRHFFFPSVSNRVDPGVEEASVQSREIMSDHVANALQSAAKQEYGKFADLASQTTVKSHLEPTSILFLCDKTDELRHPP